MEHLVHFINWSKNRDTWVAESSLRQSEGRKAVDPVTTAISSSSDTAPPCSPRKLKLTTKLVQMGFPESLAQKAVTVNRNNSVDKAITWILNSGLDSHSLSPQSSKFATQLVGMGFKGSLAQEAVCVKRNNSVEKAVTWMLNRMEEDAFKCGAEIATPSTRGTQNPVTPTAFTDANGPSKIGFHFAPYCESRGSALCADVYGGILSFLDCPAICKCGTLSQGWRAYLTEGCSQNDDASIQKQPSTSVANTARRIWTTAMDAQFGCRMAVEEARRPGFIDGSNTGFGPMASALKRLWGFGWHSLGFSRDDLDGSISATPPFSFTLDDSAHSLRQKVWRCGISKSLDSDTAATAGLFPLRRGCHAWVVSVQNCLDAAVGICSQNRLSGPPYLGQEAHDGSEGLSAGVSWCVDDAASLQVHLFHTRRPPVHLPVVCQQIMGRLRLGKETSQNVVREVMLLLDLEEGPSGLLHISLNRGTPLKVALQCPSLVAFSPAISTYKEGSSFVIQPCSVEHFWTSANSSES
jgi:hypothetical protein